MSIKVWIFTCVSLFFLFQMSALARPDIEVDEINPSYQITSAMLDYKPVPADHLAIVTNCQNPIAAVTYELMNDSNQVVYQRSEFHPTADGCEKKLAFQTQQWNVALTHGYLVQLYVVNERWVSLQMSNPLE